LPWLAKMRDKKPGFFREAGLLTGYATYERALHPGIPT